MVLGAQLLAIEFVFSPLELFVDEEAFGRWASVCRHLAGESREGWGWGKIVFDLEDDEVQRRCLCHICQFHA